MYYQKVSRTVQQTLNNNMQDLKKKNIVLAINIHAWTTKKELQI
jgi:hypothetical protein